MSQKEQTEKNETQQKSSYADGQQIKDSDLSEESILKNTQDSTLQNVYKQVLEKLELEPTYAQDSQVQMKQAVQETSELSNALDQSQIKAKVEKIISEDFQKIENLMELGVISSLQGQNLKNHVLQKTFDMIVQNEKMKQTMLPADSVSETLPGNALSEFEQENPDFFSFDGRKEVLDYLKSENVSVGKDDIKKISSIIENIEKATIERYLKKEAYEKNLNTSNELAKRKLTANAQKSGFQDGNLSKIFTREQIGKMNGTEFTKYESIIMDQLKKGLIR